MTKQQHLSTNEIRAIYSAYHDKFDVLENAYRVAWRRAAAAWGNKSEADYAEQIRTRRIGAARRYEVACARLRRSWRAPV